MVKGIYRTVVTSSKNKVLMNISARNQPALPDKLLCTVTKK